MFEIKLYKTADDLNVLNKTLTDERVLQGTLREQSSTFDPSFLLEDSEYPSENYAYIPAFGKYYILASPPVSVRNNMWMITLHEDVLMTLKDQIGQCRVRVARNENNYDAYLVDPQRAIQTKETVVTKVFPTSQSFSHAYNLLAFNSSIAWED